MSLISFTPLADGVTAVNASATNTPLSTIYNDYNGNITDANIAVSASIAGSKIKLNTISNPYKFSVYLGSNQSVNATTTSIILFDTAEFDTGSNVDLVTHKGRFTAPVAGFYLFTWNITATVSGGSTYYSTLYKNGSALKDGSRYIQGAGTDVATNPGAVLLSLGATDYIEIAWTNTSGATKTVTGNARSSWFTGQFVSAT